MYQLQSARLMTLLTGKHVSFELALTSILIVLMAVANCIATVSFTQCDVIVSSRVHLHFILCLFQSVEGGSNYGNILNTSLSTVVYSNDYGSASYSFQESSSQVLYELLSSTFILSAHYSLQSLKMQYFNFQETQ